MISEVRRLQTVVGTVCDWDPITKVYEGAQYDFCEQVEQQICNSSICENIGTAQKTFSSQQTANGRQIGHW